MVRISAMKLSDKIILQTYNCLVFRNILQFNPSVYSQTVKNKSFELQPKANQNGK